METEVFGANVKMKSNEAWEELPLFDRSKWKTVRFDHVVRVLKEKVDPESDGVERYVAGEHMDSSDVHLRRWGIVGDGYLGPAFIRGFRKGQILYGSRRTYLKKVSVADFDGVTSNTTLVLEAKDGLMQELLPWIMLSDKFTEHSVRESKGSVNPYINWKDIAWLEFALPPLDQQRRIAELLWAVDEVNEEYNGLLSAAQALIEADLSSMLYDGNAWPLRRCEDILVAGPKNGYSPPAEAEGTGLPTLSISAIRNGQVVCEGNVKYAAVRDEEVAQYFLERDDILAVRGNGNKQLCGRAGLVGDTPDSCFYPDLLIRLRFDCDLLLPEFAVALWNEPKTFARLISRAKSSNGIWKINGKDVRAHELTVPSMDAQLSFMEKLRSRQAAVAAAQSAVDKTVALRSSLINSFMN